MSGQNPKDRAARSGQCAPARRCARQGFWPGRPAPRHVRPLHAQGPRHGKPGI